MNSQRLQRNDPPRPVAYDVDGNPLYAEPPTAPRASSTLYDVSGKEGAPHYHAPRPEANLPRMSSEVRRRHDESVMAFPNLNLSEQEYIISVVRRHPIGMLPAIVMSTLMTSIVLALMFNYDYIFDLLHLPASASGSFMLLCMALILAFVLGGYVSVWVYMRNMFYLTNESVIQEIQTSIFSHTEQTVSLMNIEDASYNQRGVLQAMFNYGSIRLSTEGDETTYRFSFVANPKQEIATLNNAVEDFKNGRPVAND